MSLSTRRRPISPRVRRYDKAWNADHRLTDESFNCGSPAAPKPPRGQSQPICPILAQPTRPRCTPSPQTRHHAAQSRWPRSQLDRAAHRRRRRDTMQPRADGRSTDSTALHIVAADATPCSPEQMAAQPTRPRCMVSPWTRHHAAHSQELWCRRGRRRSETERWPWPTPSSTWPSNRSSTDCVSSRRSAPAERIRSTS
jgi:hypothetical protein